MKAIDKKPVTVFVFLALISAWTGVAIEPTQPGEQAALPCIQLVRSAAGTYSEVGIELSLRRFSTVGLIRRLQKLTLIRDYDLGRTRWSAFDPRWMFNDEEAMGLLIDGHPEAYQMRPLAQSGPRVGAPTLPRMRLLPQYLGVEALVDRWEQDVIQAGGTVSAAWRGLSYSPADKKQVSGRRRFIKRLMLELAFAYQLKNGVVPGEQPVHFTQSEQDLDWQLLPNFAEIVKFFDDVATFQTQYRDFARARLGVRTPYMRFANLPAVRAANRLLRAQGQNPITNPGAIRAEDQDQRERREMVESAARMILESGDTLYPLASLANSESGIGDAAHAGSLMPNLENIADHFNSLNEFVDEVNRALAPRAIVLERGPGIGSWAYEWLVQVGASQARELGLTRHTFNGFQNIDPDEPYFLSASSYLYLQAQKYAPRKGPLFVMDLNEQIRRRLP